MRHRILFVGVAGTLLLGVIVGPRILNATATQPPTSTRIQQPGDRSEGQAEAPDVEPGGLSEPAPAEDSPDRTADDGCGGDACEPGDPLGPVAYIKNMEEITWAQAADWWVHGELLRKRPAPERVPNETVFRFPSGSGRTADPATENAGVTVFYWNEEGSPYRNYFDGIFSSGGIQVSVTFYPTGEGVPWSNTSIEQEPVVVRGHPARLIELREGENSNVDWRAVWWEEAAPGGVLFWEISNHPDEYSKAETLSFIEDLQTYPS